MPLIAAARLTPTGQPRTNMADRGAVRVAAPDRCPRPTAAPARAVARRVLLAAPTAPDRCPRPTAAPVKAAVRRVLVVTPTALAAEISPAALMREAVAPPEAMREAATLSEAAAMDTAARGRAPRAAGDPAAWDRGAAGDGAVEAPLQTTEREAAL